MKAEHRHELKTNELAEWLANFPTWAKKNVRPIIYVTVVAVLVIGSYAYKKYKEDVLDVRIKKEWTNLLLALPHNKRQIIQAQQQGMDLSYRLLETAKKLKTFASECENERMATLALIKHGHALRAELLYRPETPNEQEQQVQIAKAKKSYKKALEKAQTDNYLAAEAKLGMGLCEEHLGNFEKAAKIYSQLVQSEKFAGTTGANQAAYRLKTMDSYKEDVVFAEATQAPAGPNQIEPAPATLTTEPIPMTPANEPPPQKMHVPQVNETRTPQTLE